MHEMLELYHFQVEMALVSEEEAEPKKAMKIGVTSSCGTCPFPLLTCLFCVMVKMLTLT